MFSELMECFTNEELLWRSVLPRECADGACVVLKECGPKGLGCGGGGLPSV